MIIVKTTYTLFYLQLCKKAELKVILLLNVIMKNITFLLLFLSILSFSSCVPTHNLTYLKGKQQENPNIGSTTPLNYSLDFNSYRLQPYDILGINVQSIVPSKYDLGTTEASNIKSQQQGGQNGNTLLSGYTISDSGYVQVPLVGSVQVVGLTVDEAASKIKTEVEERFTEVIVKVQLLTFQVTMLGEVSTPGQITIYNMRMTTILDVMALAGEPLVTANRQKVRIMRRKGSTLESYYVDLTKDDILTSPLFYVQPGDIIYVEPLKGNKSLQTNAPLIGIVSTIMNFAFFITNILIFTR
ncbi:periplasmic protein involved in polysaccharide export [Bernardetia litoralis DSM 6794]|uniref:Periplasmic protein involved in polysaccharide export n=1 Tax=Bernardetia litoralis (strain ATCC 23117 / DSM 6794 / NBRC 15988 / NCIMB 1366 / Fx l1 / Sio-4) TaxID=880071 RepID=I4AF24_BERLS|nr:polysaccharide biosynthesis/export family protein [Bernardetia litoralis]AFM02559.1 periplasmic protein involved in polysaccharide export [Bernardetia litoralis DSM 6794]